MRLTNRGEGRSGRDPEDEQEDREERYRMNRVRERDKLERTSRQEVGGGGN